MISQTVQHMTVWSNITKSTTKLRLHHALNISAKVIQLIIVKVKYFPSGKKVNALSACEN